MAAERCEARLFFGGPIDRHSFADDVVIANHDLGIGAAVADVLRLAPQHGPGENSIVLSDRDAPHHGDAVDQVRAATDADLRPNDAERPDPDFININQFESSGASRGHSMSVMFRGRVGKDFDYIWQYTLSRTTDDTGGIFSLPANNYDLRGERGLADFNRRHKLDFAGTYEFPREVKLSAVVNVRSGTPFNITTGSDDNHDTVANDRPAGIGRNTGRGPGYFNVDLSIKKQFVLGGDKTRLDLGLEAFNVFNRVNFDNFIGTLSSPFFGRANSAHRAREVQVFLRFRFETPTIR